MDFDNARTSLEVPAENHQSEGHILIENAIFFLMFISHIIPADYAISHMMLNAWRLAAVISSWIALCLYIGSKQISTRWIIMILSIFSYYIISKYINSSDGSTAYAVFHTVEVCGFITLLEYCFHRDKRRFLRILIYAGLFMCSLHYLSFVMFNDVPNGMAGNSYEVFAETVDRGNWLFLKHDNGSAFYFFPMLALLWYYYLKYDEFSLITYVFSLLTCYMYIVRWSVAAMIITSASAILFFLLRYAKRDAFLYLINYRICLLFGLMSCIVLIEISTGDISVWLSNVFGKGQGFGRYYIWYRAIDIIRDNPLFGVGYESDITTQGRLGINHCHNILIQLMYTGGIATTIPFISSLFLSGPSPCMNIHRSSAVLFLSVTFLLSLCAVDWYLYLSFPFAIIILCAYAND